MPGDMERIMREIHVMFAKAEKVSSKEDTIIVDKKKVFALLESLNHEVYNAMDRYEESQASRELALQKYREETEAMVAKASESAEEIYAGSILYSDSTLRELETEVVRARESIRQTWEEIDKKMAERLDFLEKNRRELKGQLEQMDQSRIYLELIGKAKRAEIEEAEEQKRLNKRKGAQKQAANGETQEEESSLTEEQKKIDIYVAEAYREKVPEKKNSEKKDLEKKPEEDHSVAEEESAAVEMQEFRAEDFDLDGEYFAWKEEINGAPSAPYAPETKKGLKDIFKRVK